MRYVPYSAELELFMHQLYAALSEHDRRRYAAVEALKLGHGGIVYLAQVLGCSEKTIRTGIAELYDAPLLPTDQTRKKGADASAASTP